MSDESFELELDEEWVEVRRMRQRRMLDAGISEFAAFRIAMLPDHEAWRKAVRMREGGATDDFIVDQLID